MNIEFSRLRVLCYDILYKASLSQVVLSNFGDELGVFLFLGRWNRYPVL